MNFVAYDVDDYAEPSHELIAAGHLRFELGWTEVRRGLGLILRGYFLLIGAAVVLGIAIGVALSLSPQQRAKIPWQIREIALWLGLGLFGIVAIYCYGCIVVGHWRCLMNAPERRGARWLMFGCLTCILAGPGLNLASNLTGVEKQPKLERGINGLKEIKMSKEAAIMQVGSAVVQVLGSVLFILFLRAVANCFEDRARVVLVDLYLVFSVVLLIATLYMAFKAGDFEALFRYALVLGLGWLANFAAYLIVVIVVRSGISRGLAEFAALAKRQAHGGVL
jgi:hypothetical protein